MVTRRRLDAELVRRSLARSRAHAAELIEAGRVRVRGLPASKPAAGIDPADPVILVGTEDDYVSRGAHKLKGALAAFTELDIPVKGARCLDAGASTGGFTDVLLREGASQVVAVDVGYGQLAWSLQSDDRVTVVDRTNIRHAGPDTIGGRVDVTVADLSFISLRLVLPALTRCTNADGVLLPMVKPQFEVGKERVGAKGVVRDPALRAEAVVSVATVARELGWETVGVAVSPLPGPAGNIEFFCALRSRDHSDEALSYDEIEKIVLGASAPKENSS